MKQQTSLALKDDDTLERLAVLPSDSPSAVLALIERIALDPLGDVEKLESMVAMYERLRTKEAEFAYNAAKGRILKKLARVKIAKNRSVLHEIERGNPQKGTYEAFYAPLEVDKHLRPLLVKEDMDLSYSTNRGRRRHLIRGRLKHLPGVL
jgi:hypothetical protein